MSDTLDAPAHDFRDVAIRHASNSQAGRKRPAQIVGVAVNIYRAGSFDYGFG